MGSGDVTSQKDTCRCIVGNMSSLKSSCRLPGVSRSFHLSRRRAASSGSLTTSQFRSDRVKWGEMKAGTRDWRFKSSNSEGKEAFILLKEATTVLGSGAVGEERSDELELCV